MEDVVRNRHMSVDTHLALRLLHVMYPPYGDHCEECGSGERDSRCPTHGLSGSASRLEKDERSNRRATRCLVATSRQNLAIPRGRSLPLFQPSHKENYTWRCHKLFGFTIQLAMLLPYIRDVLARLSVTIPSCLSLRT